MRAICREANFFFRSEPEQISRAVCGTVPGPRGRFYGPDFVTSSAEQSHSFPVTPFPTGQVPGGICDSVATSIRRCVQIAIQPANHITLLLRYIEIEVTEKQISVSSTNFGGPTLTTLISEIKKNTFFSNKICNFEFYEVTSSIVDRDIESCSKKNSNLSNSTIYNTSNAFTFTSLQYFPCIYINLQCKNIPALRFTIHRSIYICSTQLT